MPDPIEREGLEVHVGIIEWGSDVDLELWVADDWLIVARLAAEAIWREHGQRKDGTYREGPGDWPSFAVDMPLTAEVLGDRGRLADWHNAFREAVTVPWVTFYREGVLTSGE